MVTCTTQGPPICWQWLHIHWPSQATALQDLLGCALHPWFPLTWRLCAQRTLGSMGPPPSEWRYWNACWFAERQWICWLKLHRISCRPHSGERCAKLLDTQCVFLFGYKISLCGEPLIWRTVCPPLRLNFQSLLSACTFYRGSRSWPIATGDLGQQMSLLPLWSPVLCYFLDQCAYQCSPQLPLLKPKAGQIFFFFAKELCCWWTVSSAWLAFSIHFGIAQFGVVSWYCLPE